jgi:hypothetical protein
MSALAIAALVLACIWLGVLTLVVVLLVRQVGLLTVRLSVAGEAASLDNDGPEIGSSVPEDVALVLPDQAQEHAYLLLISSTCLPCWELATDLAEHRFEQNIVALVPGTRRRRASWRRSFPPACRWCSTPKRPDWPGRSS